jgi:hypothetical protein
MKPGNTHRHLAGVLAVAALAPACTVSRPAASPPAAARLTGSLASVAARSPRSALAVGFTGGLGGRQRALVARWNGTAWSTLSSRALPRESALGAVALFPGGAWAVGEKDMGGHGRDFFPLIVRVTGTAVRQVPVPGTGDGSSLWDVAATSAADAWAVGTTLGDPLIEHWNGTAWERARLPATVERAAGIVFGVAATSRTNAWAVMGSAGRLPLIVHWNGRRWEGVVAPAIGRGYDLVGVAATSARDVWAVGAGVIVHWNGRRWTWALIPDNLFAVSASSADNAWAVGDGALAWHWNGHTWKQTITPQSGRHGVLQGVAVIPPSGRDAWAVGDTGHQTLMLRWNGTAWQ